ncbi:hypothetical protein ACOMHN_037486 [Nucella lapillus]
MAKPTILQGRLRSEVRCFVVIVLCGVVLCVPLVLVVSVDIGNSPYFSTWASSQSPGKRWSLWGKGRRGLPGNRPLLWGHPHLIAHGGKGAGETGEITRRRTEMDHGNNFRVRSSRLNVNHPGAATTTTTSTPLPPSFQATDDIVFSPDPHLQTLFLKRLEDLPYVPQRLRPKDSCSKRLKDRVPGEKCSPLPCNESFLPPEQRLQRMLSTQYPIKEQYKEVINSLTDQSGYADIVFITAASANHYEEMLGVLHGLQNLIFPRLRREEQYSFKFLVYDLGLSRPQLKKIKRYGNCTAIIRVPIEKLPKSFQELGTCAWKPLLVMANLRQSRVTIWMDASTRFLSDNIHHVIRHALQHGIYVSSTGWMMPLHLAVPTLNYFHVHPCLLSRFNEVAGGFLALHNDAVLRRAVVGPWVSCAFSPRCLCPGTRCYARLKPCRWGPAGPYSRCHRFDQAALGAVLVTLFDWKAASFYSNKIFRFEITKFSGMPHMSLER